MEVGWSEWLNTIGWNLAEGISVMKGSRVRFHMTRMPPKVRILEKATSGLRRSSELRKHSYLSANILAALSTSDWKSQK